MPADRVEDIKIPPIRNGTVIDHITDGQSLNVLKILGVNENTIDSSISIGIHVSTNKAGMKWKDIIKIEDRELD
ncbi:MAG: aspartate carbamoyltransferase regulatory subunit, partial [Candidatus Methanomethylophilaceae archaeon]|nr:aspartate carbamoyltransferase regulatory subunit [Candidatus Methanomethylophilaceae archaeon]